MDTHTQKQIITIKELKIIEIRELIKTNNIDTSLIRVECGEWAFPLSSFMDERLSKWTNKKLNDLYTQLKEMK